MSASMTEEDRTLLASVEADAGLQDWLDREVDTLLARDAAARGARLGIAKTGHPPDAPCGAGRLKFPPESA